MQTRETWLKVVQRTLRRKPPGYVPPRHTQLVETLQSEINALHARRRSEAVNAITIKNNLQMQVRDLQARIDNLGMKLEIAEDRNDEEMASKFRVEREACAFLLTTLQVKLQRAEWDAQQIKDSIWREEEAIRLQNAEAHLIATEWSVSYLQKNMADSLRAYSGSPVTPANREKRCRALTESITKNEAEFAEVLHAAEAAVAALHEKLNAARASGDANGVRALLRALEPEEAALTLLQEAHAKARDVRLRVERWANIGTETAPEQ